MIRTTTVTIGMSILIKYMIQDEQITNIGTNNETSYVTGLTISTSPNAVGFKRKKFLDRFDKSCKTEKKGR